MTDNHAHALDVLAGTTFVVLATADANGSPWATPVWFAHEGLDRLFWLSWPGSCHSELIEQRPEVALTVFDSRAVPLHATAFYATAVARQCAGSEIDHGLEVVNRRSVAQGIGAFTRDQVTGPARLRLYAAELTAAWVLDRDADVDQRATVPRTEPARRASDPGTPRREAAP